MFIDDGTGKGYQAKVDNTNKIEIHGVSITEAIEAVEVGDAYSINTGVIGLTNSTASGVLYVKNNEDRDLEIDAIAVGIGSAGTVTESSLISVIKNPTSVSFSTDVDMKTNRNFGSSQELTVDAYKGAQGATVTGGTQLAIFYQAKGGRLFAPIDLTIPKGNSIAITIDTNTSSGTSNVYAALICHLKRK
jgi:hypothetical protein